MNLGDLLSQKVFNYIHGNNLVYNQCWEDPRLDREALKLTKEDSVLVITSAGCNALDYALDVPKKIYAIDMNPKQNALLELKIAGIKSLDFETFFKIFGFGCCDNFKEIYYSQLRPHLSSSGKAIWDKSYKFFEKSALHRSFYSRGTAGGIARMINFHIDVTGVRKPIIDIFDAPSLEAQKEIYLTQIKPRFWNRRARWFFGQEHIMYLTGVPRPQFQQTEKEYPGGAAQFVEDCIESVFTRVPLKDNYFWWLYCYGSYTKERCPEYLKEENFLKLKNGLVDSIEMHTMTILDFLNNHQEKITRFVLLDHMDWLYSYYKEVLWKEWQAIIDSSHESARILWRSGGLRVKFIDPIEVTVKNQRTTMKDLLSYKSDLAWELHEKDRVHTYGSFYIADLKI